MNLKKIVKTFAFTALFTLSGQQAAAQDLLARQAPVDKKMKSVDTLTFQQLLDREYSGLPAEDLYADWENKYAHRATQLPDEYKIDLRDFCMPTPSRVITSNFGPRWRRQHKGLDIKVYVGDTIRSAFSGMVRMVKYEAAGYGKYIVIRHDNGLETIYGHLSKQLVKENQRVKAGDVIGLGGNTGRSTGSHLHFETRLLGQPINPAFMFDFEKQDVTADIYVCNNKALTRGKEDLMDIEQMENEVALREGSVLVSTGISEQNLDEDESKEEIKVAYAKPSKKGKNARVNNTVEKAKNGVHIVKSGDTLSAIAKANHTTVEALCKKNGIKKDSMLSLKQKIRI